jgi:hypothetical protein
MYNLHSTNISISVGIQQEEVISRSISIVIYIYLDYLDQLPHMNWFIYHWWMVDIHRAIELVMRKLQNERMSQVLYYKQFFLFLYFFTRVCLKIHIYIDWYIFCVVLCWINRRGTTHISLSCLLQHISMRSAPFLVLCGQKNMVRARTFFSLFSFNITIWNSLEFEIWTRTYFSGFLCIIFTQW